MSIYLLIAAGGAGLAYLIYEAVTTYQHTPGESWRTAFHGYTSIIVLRAQEAFGYFGLLLVSIPEARDLIQTYLPPWALPVFAIVAARAVAYVRMQP